jgi:hypothetical protein
MNKERERQAIDDVKRLDPEFPPGTIEPGEAPDFVVRTDRSCVGIEVCEYFRPERPLGSHPKEQEALTHHITDRATARAIEAGVPPCWVVVTFERNVRLLKRDIDTVADAIVDAIRTGRTYLRNNGKLPSCIDDIVVHPLPAGKELLVAPIGTTWVPPTDADELARLIATKEGKLPAYRARCDVVWLLIVIDGFQLSSMTERPTSLPSIATAFDRVLVLHDRTTVLTVPRA